MLKCSNYNKHPTNETKKCLPLEFDNKCAGVWPSASGLSQIH